MSHLMILIFFYGCGEDFVIQYISMSVQMEYLLYNSLLMSVMI